MRPMILGVIAITSTMTLACTMTETRTTQSEGSTEPEATKTEAPAPSGKWRPPGNLVQPSGDPSSFGKLKSGTGAACGLGTGDASCDACLDASCCTENKACIADADCRALITCGNACTDDACFGACFSAHPTGAAILETLVTCFDNGCSATCRGGSSSGGSPPPVSACGFASGDATCDACLDASCCADANACLADADCIALLNCAEACSDAACVSSCETAHATGATLLNTLSSCAQTSCATTCGF